MGVPAAGVDALRHPGSDADGVVVEWSFPGLGRCICVFLKRPQDHEGAEMGRRLIFDVHKKSDARPFPRGAEKGR